jgi:hypothetical protein
MQENEPKIPDGASETQKKGDLDMHSSKEHENVQGGQGGSSSDKEKNSGHDEHRERSIAGREDS